MRPAVPPFFSPEGERSRRCNGRYPDGATRDCALHPIGSAPSSVRPCRRPRTIAGSLWAGFEPTTALQRLYRAGVYLSHREGVKRSGSWRL